MVHTPTRVGAPRAARPMAPPRAQRRPCNNMRAAGGKVFGWGGRRGAVRPRPTTAGTCCGTHDGGRDDGGGPPRPSPSELARLTLAPLPSPTSTDESTPPSPAAAATRARCLPAVRRPAEPGHSPPDGRHELHGRDGCHLFPSAAHSLAHCHTPKLPAGGPPGSGPGAAGPAAQTARSARPRRAGKCRRPVPKSGGTSRAGPGGQRGPGFGGPGPVTLGVGGVGWAWARGRRPPPRQTQPCPSRAGAGRLSWVGAGPPFSVLTGSIATCTASVRTRGPNWSTSCRNGRIAASPAPCIALKLAPSRRLMKSGDGGGASGRADMARCSIHAADRPGE